jgi:curved DNA-binding protein CbpA
MAPDPGTENYYGVLNVDPSALQAEIRRAYRRMVLQTHPDRTGTADAARFRRVREAYLVLCDPLARERYDALMGLGRYGGGMPVYHRSLNRLFDNLFGGLRATLDMAPTLTAELEKASRAAGWTGRAAEAEQVQQAARRKAG